MPDLNKAIEQAVRSWPQWSRAERRRMEDMVKDFFDHCRNGGGNTFVRLWCERNLAHLFTH